MPTPNERKALTFLVLVALSGTAVRLVRAHGARAKPATQDSVALDAQLQRVDSVRARKNQRDRLPVADAAPSVPATMMDLDRASASDIELLPGVGPALASRIVANRDSAGAFGNLDGLCDVSGIGPALAERLRPLVTFSGAPRPVSDGCGAASKPRAKGRAPHARNRR